MALIKSISGIRGTIGGKPGETLSPPDIVSFTTAFAELLKQQLQKDKIKIIIGRDGRVSGDMVSRLVSGSLMAVGADVTDLGLSTTPTVEMAVPHLKADGGIILTASHNPIEWNALKLLNARGEFINAAEGQQLLKIAEKKEVVFAAVDQLGTYTTNDQMINWHIDQILQHPWVDVESIRKAGFKIAVDAINSSGAISIPPLLEKMGVSHYRVLNGEANGIFAHNPEPLKEHLTDISNVVRNGDFDLGIVVDPDVDRLAFIQENGMLFGEEYTLVAVADYVLGFKKGNTVSNLSSSRALRDVTVKHGGSYYTSAVGEVNVVAKMKEVDAVIGGEGNGGIIFPDLHYGRDSLVGMALFLSFLARSGTSLSRLRASYPDYHMIKSKIQLKQDLDVDKLLDAVASAFEKEQTSRVDGVKIDFKEGWVHLRKSNTEPIIRLYAEATTEKKAHELIGRVKAILVVDN